jgi:hypothetical protein
VGAILESQRGDIRYNVTPTQTHHITLIFQYFSISYENSSEDYFNIQKMVVPNSRSWIAIRPHQI